MVSTSQLEATKRNSDFYIYWTDFGAADLTLRAPQQVFH